MSSTFMSSDIILHNKPGLFGKGMCSWNSSSHLRIIHEHKTNQRLKQHRLLQLQKEATRGTKPTPLHHYTKSDIEFIWENYQGTSVPHFSSFGYNTRIQGAKIYSFGLKMT